MVFSLRTLVFGGSACIVAGCSLVIGLKDHELAAVADASTLSDAGGDETDAPIPLEDAASDATDEVANPPVCDGGTTCASGCVDTKTDEANCGGCGVVCAGSCNGGRCVVTLATEFNDASTLTLARMQIDATFVYYLGEFAQTQYIHKVLINGTATSMPIGLLFNGGVNAFPGFAIDDTMLYETLSPGSDDEIFFATKTGASEQLLAELPGAYGAQEIVLDDRNVYWRTSGSHVLMHPKPGVEPADAASTTVTMLVPDAGGNVLGITNDGTRVYWTDVSGGVHSVLADGGATTTLVAAGQGNPRRIVAANGALYWADPQLQAIEMLSLVGADNSPCTLVNAENPSAIAVTATAVYFVTTDTSGASSIARAPVTCGSTPASATTLYTGAKITDVAADATNAYWLEMSAAGVGSVNKLTPN